MRSLVLALGLFFSCGALSSVGSSVARGDVGKLIAVGDWSEPTGLVGVGGLRGRLVITEGRTFKEGRGVETRVYVEVENSPDGAPRTVDFYFDPAGLTCELVDANGKPVPGARGFGSGGRPGACWVTLPHDSTMRLRVNPYGFGRAKEDGLLIPLNNAQWLIPAGATGEFWLSGARGMASAVCRRGHGDAAKMHGHEDETMPRAPREDSMSSREIIM
jgi:hypothetical protein